MQIAFFVLGFLLFIGLVLIHEWGHYIAAKRNGVEVEEFGLGFPPRAWGRKIKSGMVLSLNWLPLGGFVKMKGEHDLDTRPKSFGAASLGAKTKILLAGVSMNLIVGILILTILAAIGMPKLIDNQYTVPADTKTTKQFVVFGAIDKDSPAAKANIKSFDQVLSIEGPGQTYYINTAKQLHDATQKLAGQQVTISYIRKDKKESSRVKLLSKQDVINSLKSDNHLSPGDKIISISGESVAVKGKIETKNLTSDSALYELSKNNDFKNLDKLKITYIHNGTTMEKTGSLIPKGFLGIVPTELQVRRSTWSAPVVALGFTGQLIWLTLQGLGHAIAGLGSIIAGFVTSNPTARTNGQSEAGAQVGGPVAIVAVLWGGGNLGVIFVLMIIAIISLTLALMNVLPIPALDGGRLAVTLFSRKILKRPVNPRWEERIHGTGMAVLMFFVLLITIADVKRFF